MGVCSARLAIGAVAVAAIGAVAVRPVGAVAVGVVAAVGVVFLQRTTLETWSGRWPYAHRRDVVVSQDLSLVDRHQRLLSERPRGRSQIGTSLHPDYRRSAPPSCRCPETAAPSMVYYAQNEPFCDDFVMR